MGRIWKKILSGALVALLFSRVERFVQLWSRALSETILWKYFEFGPVVQEKMSLKDIIYLKLWQLHSLVEQNHLCNFGRRHNEEQFCEIILNLDLWYRRRCRLKIFLIWSSGSPFIQPSWTICAILVEDIMRNNSVKLFWIWTGSSGRDVI